MARCEPYAEHKKDTTTKRIGSSKSKHLADIIIQKILETDVVSAQEWEDIIPPDFRLQLIKEFGLTVDSYIQKILRIVKSQKIGTVKKESFPVAYGGGGEGNHDGITGPRRRNSEWVQFQHSMAQVSLPRKQQRPRRVPGVERVYQDNAIYEDKFHRPGGIHQRREIPHSRKPDRRLPTGRDTSRARQFRIPPEPVTGSLLRAVRRAAYNTYKRRHLEITLGREGRKNRHQAQGQGRDKAHTDLDNHGHAHHQSRGRQRKHPDRTAHASVRIYEVYQTSEDQSHSGLRAEKTGDQESSWLNHARPLGLPMALLL